MENKRVAIVNGVSYGSTYTICESVKKKMIESGHNVLSFYGWTKKHKKPINHTEIIGSFWSRFFHLIVFRITKREGMLSILDTKRIVKKLERFSPDVINIHLLHCQDLNFRILFNYINKNNIKVIWTFHDCWAFTGGCFHFDYVDCKKWKDKCCDCIQCSGFAKYAFNKMYKIKKNIFTSIKDMIIVTPSRWMSKFVRESFFRKYECKVINNGIDTAIFKRKKSNIFSKLGILNKTIILGVAFGWNEKKGLDVFIKLSKDLDSNKYKIVLIGVDEKTKKSLPKEIIYVERTNNTDELVEFYSSADVLVCPTREDNFPTVLMESISCGTPVISYDTGGCREIIEQSNFGILVGKDDYKSLLKEILGERYKKLNEPEKGLFDRENMTELYLKLICEDKKSVDEK